MLELLASWIVRGKAIQNKVAVAHDNTQEVVEIVGDATCQQPHRLHLLGNDQLLLKTLAIGNVLRDSKNTDDKALAILDLAGAQEYGKVAVILAAAEAFASPSATENRAGSNFFIKSRRIVSRDERFSEELANNLVFLVPGGLKQSLIGKRDATVGIADGNQLGTVLDGLSQATDPLFRPFAFRNIQLDGDEVGDVSSPVFHRSDGHLLLVEGCHPCVD